MAKKDKKSADRYKEIRNAKAHRDFFVEQKFETGIVLKGTEIKSVREGGAQINDAFCRIEQGKVMLYHAHIKEYSHGTDANHNPYRPRQLLLNRKEMYELEMALQAGGRALIPLRMYFKKALLKCEIGLCTAKQKQDKRGDLKEKVEMREAERSWKYR